MEDNKNFAEQDTPAATAGNTQIGGRDAPGMARILAKAGEAFDAVEAGRAMNEAGLKDPAKLEPTDQSFLFADPRQGKAVFVGDDETLQSAEKNSQPLAAADGTLPQAPPALDLTEAPDPGIPWRTRPVLTDVEALPTGVLQADQSPSCPHGLYDTEPGLFGPGSSSPDDGEAEAAGHSELVLGVKLREYGSVYFFRAGQETIRTGGKVLVDTENGPSLAEVISAHQMRLPLPKIRTAEGEELAITPIKGLAGPEDIAAAADNKILSSGARLFCKQCIRERNLDMKLVDVEVLHDRSKIIFYFTAPARIDFRELVKDLVRNYRTRIELRQIGVRHETQMLGALGNCGMSCCCRRYLRSFAPVTIKMAKEQNLFLNPAKLSGICGRLLCCLSNEQENYEAFHRNCPKIGKKYQTIRGTMKVLRANLFRQSIMAVDESGNEEEFQLDSWNDLQPQRLETRETQKEAPEQREGRAERSTGFEDQDGARAEAAAAGIPADAEATEEDLAALMDEAVAVEAQNGPPQDKRGRSRGKRGGADRRPREYQGQGQAAAQSGAAQETQGLQPKARPGRQGAPQPERQQRAGIAARAQNDVTRLKSSLGDGEDGTKTDARQREQGAAKSDADNSIFGLPGSKYQK